MLTLIPAYDMPFINVVEYYNSFAASEYKDINNFAIGLVPSGEKKYLEWVLTYEIGMYYLVDDSNPNYIIGYGNIEDSIFIDYHREYSNIGNIGYGIRPNERCKGYGTELLRMLLLKCEENGMSEVCVSCGKGNIASEKVILKNGGVFEKEFYDDFEGAGLKHWIKLHPKIKNKIKRFIKKSK